VESQSAELFDRLKRVAESGSPAQRDAAQRLLSLLASHPSAEARRAAAQLVEAYFHDPYLERSD